MSETMTKPKKVKLGAIAPDADDTKPIGLQPAKVVPTGHVPAPTAEEIAAMPLVREMGEAEGGYSAVNFNTVTVPTPAPFTPYVGMACLYWLEDAGYRLKAYPAVVCGPDAAEPDRWELVRFVCGAHPCARPVYGARYGESPANGYFTQVRGS